MDGQRNTLKSAASSLGRERPPLPSELRVAAVEAGKDLAQKFGRLERLTADQVGRLARNSVVRRRRPGRKTTERVRKPAAMRKRNVPWLRIYREVIPGYSKMTDHEKFYETHRLRDAVGHHFKRRPKLGRKGRAEDEA